MFVFSLVIFVFPITQPETINIFLVSTERNVFLLSSGELRNSPCNSMLPTEETEVQMVSFHKQAFAENISSGNVQHNIILSSLLSERKYSCPFRTLKVS